MDLTALEVRFIKFSKGLNSSFGLLESNETKAKWCSTTPLPKRNFDILNLTVFTEQILKFFLCDRVRQIHHKETLVVNEVILSGWLFFLRLF